MSPVYKEIGSQVLDYKLFLYRDDYCGMQNSPNRAFSKADLTVSMQGGVLLHLKRFDRPVQWCSERICLQVIRSGKMLNEAQNHNCVELDHRT